LWIIIANPPTYLTKFEKQKQTVSNLKPVVFLLWKINLPEIRKIKTERQMNMCHNSPIFPKGIAKFGNIFTTFG
jgi:hypothetical protein